MAAETPLPPDLLFLQWLIDECGYVAPKPLIERPGYYAVVQPKAFTHAIILGRIGDRLGYDTHWCYATRTDAVAALDRWNGTGEPTGWMRHPDTGRRVSRDPNERDEFGQPVGAVGVEYIRL